MTIYGNMTTHACLELVTSQHWYHNITHVKLAVFQRVTSLLPKIMTNSFNSLGAGLLEIPREPHFLCHFALVFFPGTFCHWNISVICLSCIKTHHNSVL